MPLMDEFREERAAMKNATPKEKFLYFWDYYKWHVVIIVAVSIFLGTFIYQYATKKETALNVVMMNGANMTDMLEYTQSFGDFAGIDLTKNDIIWDTSIRTNATDIIGDVNYTSLQKLTVYTAAAELDAMVTDTESFQKYANSYTFYDLREILTPTQLAACEPYFYYVDWKTVEEIQAANNAFDSSYVATYKDPTKPGEMEQPVPVGIYLDSCDELLNNFYFNAQADNGENIVMGIYTNTTRLETVLQYVDFLMEDAK